MECAVNNYTLLLLFMTVYNLIIYPSICITPQNIFSTPQHCALCCLVKTVLVFHGALKIFMDTKNINKVIIA